MIVGEDTLNHIDFYLGVQRQGWTKVQGIPDETREDSYFYSMYNSFMRIINLTMPITEDMPVWSPNRKPKLAETASIDKEGWNEHDLHISTHLGTHIDAPLHFVKNGKGLGKKSFSFIQDTQKSLKMVMVRIGQFCQKN